MAMVTTWTGRDANALRSALRMSVTAFAEHLGAARRTVAKWSSQGDKVLPRADMQAALDTVLSRAKPEVRERFEALRTAGTSSAPAGAARPDADAHADTGDDGNGDSGSGGDVRRRDLLRGAAIGVAAVPNVAPLLDALFSPPRSHGAALSFPQFSRAVAATKIDYQACRYERVLDRLVALLPSLEAVGPARMANSGRRSRPWPPTCTTSWAASYSRWAIAGRPW